MAATSQIYLSLRNFRFKHRLKVPVFAILLLLSFPSLTAQQSNTMYLLHNIPQSNLLNPAVQLRCNFFAGIPLLGTVHADYANTSFTYNDIASGTDWQFDEVYNMLNRMNTVSVDIAAYPLYLGFRRDKSYFTFSIAERFRSYNSFSRNLIGMLLYGNTQYIGESARFNNTRLNAAYYREYAAGWSYRYDRETYLGARAKLLFGKANFSTGASRVRIGTDFETFDLTVRGNVKFNNSFPISIWQNNIGEIDSINLQEINYFRMFMNPRNVGLAFDIGIVHEYERNITLSASLIDVGFMFWTDDLYNIGAEVDFLYAGASESTDFSTAAYFRDLSDSIANDIIYDVTQRPFLTPLPLQLFLGGAYEYNKNLSFGLTIRNLFVNRRLHTSLTASANIEFLDFFQGSLSWTYRNNTLRNVGAALAYTGQGIQFFAASDNLLGFIQPLDTRSLNLRFGVNLMLGCPIEFFKFKGDERSMIPCPANQKKSRKKN